VADFDDATSPQARTWSVPYRKGGKTITIETVCSVRPVPTHRMIHDSSDSNLSDMSSHAASDDDNNGMLLHLTSNLQQTFTGQDLIQSALKFQSDSDYHSESDVSPAKSAISPPMLGIGGTGGLAQRQIHAAIWRQYPISDTPAAKTAGITNPDGRLGRVGGGLEGVSDSPLISSGIRSIYIHIYILYIYIYIYRCIYIYITHP